MTDALKIVLGVAPFAIYVVSLFFVSRRYRERIDDLECALKMRAALMPARTQAEIGRSYPMVSGDTLEFVGTGVAICLTAGAATVEVRAA